jgi:hypothetical protein
MKYFQNILVITLIIFIISCSSNRNNQDENLRKDLSVFFTTNLNDSSIILDSFFLIKIDTISEKQKLNEQASALLDNQNYILKLLENDKNQLSIISDKIKLYRLLESESLVDIEINDFKKIIENTKLESKELDSISVITQKLIDAAVYSDSIKPIAFQAICFYQIKNLDKSIKRDTAYIFLNLNKDIIKKADFLSLPYILDYDKFK